MRTDSGMGWRPAFALAVLLQSVALVGHLASHTADATTDSAGGQERFAVASHPGQAAHFDAPSGESRPDDAPCICGQHGGNPERAPTARQESPTRDAHARGAETGTPIHQHPTGPARAPPSA